MIIRKQIGILFMLVFSLSACQKNSIYHHSEHIPSKGWALNQTLYFQDSIRADAPDTLCYEVELTHNNLYPYKNIWIYLRTKAYDGTDRLDSINWVLSKPSGTWIGDGWGSIYSLSHQLPNLVLKPSKGNRWFRIEVQHGLKDAVLGGVENLGIKLFVEK